MSGRPDFSQAGTAGGGQTVAVTERPELTKIDISNTSSLASGSSERIEVFAPTGSVYNITGMELVTKADGTATSGSHAWVPRPLDHLAVLYGEATYNNIVRFGRSHWQDADSLAQPPSAAAQNDAVKLLKATENSPLVLEYRNNTDAAQDNSRDARLVVEEVSY